MRWADSTADSWAAHWADLMAMHLAVLLVEQKDEQPVDLKEVLLDG